MRAVQALRRNLGPLAFVVALLLGVSLLPPDTSLAEVRRTGVLRACVPDAYPPLVTGEAGRPGIDVELLGAVAAELGVSLSLNRISAIGRDFNPRNWRVTRAHCEVLAGGVVDAPLTRSFLATGPAYAETAWATIAPPGAAELSERRVGVLAIVSGLDRIGLAGFLRGAGAEVRIVQRPGDLAEALAEGSIDAGITEALLARQIARGHDWEVELLGPPLQRYNVVFGLWKGDLTLKWAIEAAFDRLRRDGRLDAILAAYLGDVP